MQKNHKKIAIVDYGCGNILSLSRAIEKLGYNSELTKEQTKILNSDLLILPGVGAFENAMKLLKSNNLIHTLNEYVKIKKKPLLGICLGMQMLLSKSYEMGEHDGLDFISGEVISIKSKSKKRDIKIPHISWNEILINNKDSDEILRKELIKKNFYFIHSFMSLTKEKKNTIAHCKYFDVEVPAIIRNGNVAGCQFHPEKSGRNGLNLLKNIIETLK
tara:strand:+ start:1118 stop:1768 length:651 start_codon:yes stop_codon:yes gene_type:complete